MQEITALSAGLWIYAVLSENLQGYVTDVFPVMNPEAKLPFVAYRRSSLDGPAIKGAIPPNAAIVEVAACADSYPASVELAEKVRMALEGGHGSAGGVKVRDCILINASESYDADAYVQTLTFKIFC